MAEWYSLKIDEWYSLQEEKDCGMLGYRKKADGAGAAGK